MKCISKSTLDRNNPLNQRPQLNYRAFWALLKRCKGGTMKVCRQKPYGHLRVAAEMQVVEMVCTEIGWISREKKRQRRAARPCGKWHPAGHPKERTRAPRLYFSRLLWRLGSAAAEGTAWGFEEQRKRETALFKGDSLGAAPITPPSTPSSIPSFPGNLPLFMVS